MIFLRYFLWEASQAPEGKSHSIYCVWGMEVGVALCYLEFLTLRLAHTELPEVYQLQFRFSYPSPHPYEDMYLFW